MINFLLCIIGIPVLIVGTIVLVIYLDFRQQEKEVKKDQEWLKAELEKPQYFIEFVTIDNRTFNSARFEPYNTLEGSDWNMRLSSKNVANKHLAACYERGYFENSKGVTYPACNIQHAEVKK